MMELHKYHTGIARESGAAPETFLFDRTAIKKAAEYNNTFKKVYYWPVKIFRSKGE